MKKEMNRREMLKLLLASGVGLGASAMSNFIPVGKLTATPNISGSMPMRRLGKTGYNVGLFSLGGESTVEQRHQKQKAVEIINKALDLGVNYIDTSHIYGRGGSEENIGEVMAGRRKEVFLATKTGAEDYDGAMRQFETSLERLQTDYIDLYQHHHVVRDNSLARILSDDGALKAFRKLQDEGVVRHLGITSHSPRILRNALQEYDYECALITLNPAGISMNDSEYLDEFFSIAKQKDVGVIGMKVFGKGRIFRRDINMQQAFGYTLSHPVATAIIGITELEQVEKNLELAKNFEPFTESQLSEIKKMVG